MTLQGTKDMKGQLRASPSISVVASGEGRGDNQGLSLPHPCEVDIRAGSTGRSSVPPVLTPHLEAVLITALLVAHLAVPAEATARQTELSAVCELAWAGAEGGRTI
eukprot:scaffold49382_cov28-Tisochrysis_lutea.AAC.1